MENSRDLILGNVVYISIIYRILDSQICSFICSFILVLITDMTGENRELDTHAIYTLITRALMAFFAMFCTVFNTYEKRCICFRSKNFPRVIFNLKICYRYD